MNLRWVLFGGSFVGDRNVAIKVGIWLISIRILLWHCSVLTLLLWHTLPLILISTVLGNKIKSTFAFKLLCSSVSVIIVSQFLLGIRVCILGRKSLQLGLDWSHLILQLLTVWGTHGSIILRSFDSLLKWRRSLLLILVLVWESFVASVWSFSWSSGRFISERVSRLPKLVLLFFASSRISFLKWAIFEVVFCQFFNIHSLLCWRNGRSIFSVWRLTTSVVIILFSRSGFLLWTMAWKRCYGVILRNRRSLIRFSLLLLSDGKKFVF